MNVSHKWLKNYIDSGKTGAELGDLLTSAGLAVDAVSPLNTGLKGAVTGRLLTVEPHPNANKLSVCQVDVGSETLTIVTGATNVAAGHVVPVAVPGTVLPDGTIISTADFRGIMSHGMLMSTDEMGIDRKTVPTHQRDGIYLFPADTPLGVDVAKVMGLDDEVLELDLTPNRSDCLGLMGVAYDVAALTGAKVITPELLPLGHEVCSNDDLTVDIQAKDLCPGYLGLVVDVQVAESPLWLQNLLRSVGLRPINNVVDITNFVMWEQGQPLHAFDYDKIEGQRIVVRESKSSETITLIDGTTQELPVGTLVIADSSRPVAIAGVMGGLDSEVTLSTRRIVLESALFSLVSIRRTSRALGIRTDASARFDKGVDPAGLRKALSRAASLFTGLSVGTVHPTPVGVAPKHDEYRPVALRPSRVNSLLGTNLLPGDIETILIRLGFRVEPVSMGLNVFVPSRRQDVIEEIDLVEEVGRIHGMHHIPTLPMVGQISQGKLTEAQRLVRNLRHTLIALGVDEIQTLSFYDRAHEQSLGLPNNHPWTKAIVLQNPLSRERGSLRPALVPGMIEVLSYNQARQTPGMSAFEIGVAFIGDDNAKGKQPTERLTLCIGAYGVRLGNWTSPLEQLDFFYLKGIVEALLPDAVFVPSEHVFLHAGRQAEVMVNGLSVGFIGELHPQVNLRERTKVCEIDLYKAFGNTFGQPEYRGLNRVIPVERDLAFVVSEAIPAADILSLVSQVGGFLVKGVLVFDVYTGPNLPEGMRSLAIRLTLAKDSGTFTEPELTELLSKIRVAVESAFSAVLRSAGKHSNV